MERCGSVIPAGRVALGRCLKSETLAWNKCNRLGFQGQKKKESGRSSWQRTDAFRRAIRYRKSAAAGRKMKLEGNARCKAAESTADM